MNRIIKSSVSLLLLLSLVFGIFAVDIQDTKVPFSLTAYAEEYGENLVAGANLPYENIANVEICVPIDTTVYWKFKAKLSVDVIGNIPEGCKIVWYDNNALIGEGLSFITEPVKSECCYTVKIVDSKGKSIDDGIHDKAFNLGVYSGFFGRIVSFFKRLFGSDTVELSLRGQYIEVVKSKSCSDEVKEILYNAYDDVVNTYPDYVKANPFFKMPSIEKFVETRMIGSIKDIRQIKLVDDLPERAEGLYHPYTKEVEIERWIGDEYPEEKRKYYDQLILHECFSHAYEHTKYDLLIFSYYDGLYDVVTEGAAVWMSEIIDSIFDQEFAYGLYDENNHKRYSFYAPMCGGDYALYYKCFTVLLMLTDYDTVDEVYKYGDMIPVKDAINEYTCLDGQEVIDLIIEILELNEKDLYEDQQATLEVYNKLKALDEMVEKEILSESKLVNDKQSAYVLFMKYYRYVQQVLCREKEYIDTEGTLVEVTKTNAELDDIIVSLALKYDIMGGKEEADYMEMLVPGKSGSPKPFLPY